MLSPRAVVLCLSLSAVWISVRTTDATPPCPPTKRPAEKPGVTVGEMVVTNKPVTVKVLLGKDLQQDIVAAVDSSKQTVRLTLRGVVPPGKDVTGLNVFLNKPEADSKTMVTDPHFVGAVEFQPNAKNNPQAFNLDLTPVIRQLGDKVPLDKHLSITVIAVPADDTLPPDVQIPFTEVAVSVGGNRK